MLALDLLQRPELHHPLVSCLEPSNSRCAYDLYPFSFLFRKMSEYGITRRGEWWCGWALRVPRLSLALLFQCRVIEANGQTRTSRHLCYTIFKRIGPRNRNRGAVLLDREPERRVNAVIRNFTRDL